jgi:hypothetical protein
VVGQKKTHSFLTHNRSCGAMKALIKRHQTVPFLTHNFSYRCEKGRLERSEHPENNRFVVWKRIGSCPLLGIDELISGELDMHERFPLNEEIF